MCGPDTSEALRARVAHFERIVIDTGARRSCSWQPLQPVLVATAADAYPDHGRSAETSWA